MSNHLWVRAETKALEQRCGLSSESAKELVARGFKVTVEQSDLSCFDSVLFENAGCELVASGSWRQAPDKAFILGLKELPESDVPLNHRHIYFAHAYKGQQGWQELLMRFHKGGGILFDLEYLEDPPGRRVATFGYWAGFAGAALAVLAWVHRQTNAVSDFACADSYPEKESLIDDVKSHLTECVSAPRVMVIGAAGRCGLGASELLNSLGLDLTCWDIEETRRGGPFNEILDHDIFINCVFVSEPIQPFLTHDSLARPRRLSVICDVSCDPLSAVNPLPIYHQTTSFNHPTVRVADGEPVVDLIAIDHLPSMLPAESSASFSEQLLPYLCQLDDLRQGVWAAAKRKFDEMAALAKEASSTRVGEQL